MTGNQAPTLTSAELNAAIASVCDDSSVYESFGGKSIPYIGWFWRRVDFDAPTCRFAVIPAGSADIGIVMPNDQIMPLGPRSPADRVGFCESNKWDYREITATPEQFAEIRRLLIVAVALRTADAFRAADAAIQALNRPAICPECGDLCPRDSDGVPRHDCPVKGDAGSAMPRPVIGRVILDAVNMPAEVDRIVAKLKAGDDVHVSDWCVLTALAESQRLDSGLTFVRLGDGVVYDMEGFRSTIRHNIEARPKGVSHKPADDLFGSPEASS